MIYAYINHQLFAPSYTLQVRDKEPPQFAGHRPFVELQSQEIQGTEKPFWRAMDLWIHIKHILMEYHGDGNIHGNGNIHGKIRNIRCSTANRHRELSPFRALRVGGLEVSKGGHLLEQISGSPKAKAKSDWASSGLCIPQITQKQTKRCNFIFCCRTYPG